jgi:hypothetical protein
VHGEHYLLPVLFFWGDAGVRVPKHFVNLTGESKNFKMLEFPLNQLQTYYGYLCKFLSFMHLFVFFWVFPWRQIKFCRRFGTLCQVHIQRLDEEYLTPGKYPKENIQVSEHGENLKSRSFM